MLSPDLMRYIIDPDKELSASDKSKETSLLDKYITKFNISELNKAKNDCGILQNFFKKYFFRNI